MHNKKNLTFIRLLVALTATLALLLLAAACSTPKQTLEEANAALNAQPPQNQLAENLKDTPYVDPDASTQPNTTQPASPKQDLTPQISETEILRPLKPADILTLPAGTVISSDQLDQQKIANYFMAVPIPDDIINKINGKSYIQNPNITLDQLRYLKVLHYNYQHKIQIGELLINATLADEFLDIFRELFNAGYEIYSMYLVEDFWTGDTISTDDATCFANNTSAFSYRLVPETGNLSLHALGLAIDINPVENPYVEYINGVPTWLDPNSDPYIDRTTGKAHMITHQDACFKAFNKRGYTWGGDWWSPKDYQHFEK